MTENPQFVTASATTDTSAAPPDVSTPSIEQADETNPIGTGSADLSSDGAPQTTDEPQEPEIVDPNSIRDPRARDIVDKANKAFQRKAREAAEAKRVADESARKLSELEQLKAGWERLMQMPNADQMVREFQKQAGVIAGPPPERAKFAYTPSQDLKISEDAKAALVPVLNDLTAQFQAWHESQLEARLAPAIEGSKRFESAENARIKESLKAEFGALAEKHWNDVQRGIKAGYSPRAALMAAAPDEAATALAQKKARAAAAKGTQTPVVMQRGRNTSEAVFTGRPQKLTFADYVKKFGAPGLGIGQPRQK